MIVWRFSNVDDQIEYCFFPGNNNSRALLYNTLKKHPELHEIYKNCQEIQIRQEETRTESFHEFFEENKVKGIKLSRLRFLAERLNYPALIPLVLNEFTKNKGSYSMYCFTDNSMGHTLYVARNILEIILSIQDDSMDCIDFDEFDINEPNIIEHISILYEKCLATNNILFARGIIHDFTQDTQE